MRNPLKSKSDPTVVPAVQVCEDAKADAVQKLEIAARRLQKASRGAIQFPSDESRLELKTAQDEKDSAEQWLNQCELANQDARAEHAEDLVKAAASKRIQMEEKILKACPSIERDAKEAREDLDKVISRIFEIGKKTHELTIQANEAGLTDGTSVQDSLLSTARIVGYFRQHLRKCGGDGQAMSWAYPHFESVQTIPTFDENVHSGLGWLTKMFSKNQAQAGK